MSPEERQMLTALFDRVKSAAAAPRDADAEALISQSVRDQPYAPYLLAQAVLVQEQGMKAATDRIKQLEDQVRDLQESASRPQPAAQSSGGSFLGGLGSLFGGGQQPAPQPQRPSPPQQTYGQPQGYAPQQNYSQPQPGPWGQQQQPTGPWSQQPQAQSAGGGFLRGALGTAAGVAGGVMLAEGISSLFSPHLGGVANAASLGGFANPAAAIPGTGNVEETVVNNYYGSDNNQGSKDGNDQASGSQGGSDDDFNRDYAQDQAQDAADDAADYDNSDFDNSDDSFNV
jgi:hypothetical protein